VQAANAKDAAIMRLKVSIDNAIFDLFDNMK